MPTILTHAVIPATLRTLQDGKLTDRSLLVTGCLLAILPDFDVIGFRFGIAYGDQWGHRGATHSAVFAILVVAALLMLRPAWRSWQAGLFLLASMASHGLLDMLTDGGKGVALLWPFSSERLFFAWTPIRVSPIGARFFSASGLATLVSEVGLVWLPCAAILLARRFARRKV